MTSRHRLTASLRRVSPQPWPLHACIAWLQQQPPALCPSCLPLQHLAPYPPPVGTPLMPPPHGASQKATAMRLSAPSTPFTSSSRKHTLHMHAAPAATPPPPSPSKPQRSNGGWPLCHAHRLGFGSFVPSSASTPPAALPNASRPVSVGACPHLPSQHPPPPPVPPFCLPACLPAPSRRLPPGWCACAPPRIAPPRPGPRPAKNTPPGRAA